MSLSKLARIVLISALLVMGVGTIVPSAAQGSNTLIMARSVDATGLDPQVQTAFSSLRLLDLIYDPLVRTDADLNIIPALAESWEFSADGLTLTFHLRQGVTFHDGSDFTSADVVASLNRILDQATGAATRSNLVSIDSIDAPDDYTVVLHLNTVDVPLLAALSSRNAAILSSDVIANGDPSKDAVGTGPFILDSWEPDQKTELKANPNYWGGAPAVDGVEIRIIPEESSILAALRAGEIDFALFLDPLIATLITEPSITLNRTPDISYHALMLRASVEPLNILEVRQAISCAIDRQAIVDTAALGEGQVTGPITMPAWRVPLDELFCYTPNLDMAKSLMKQAGMEAGFKLPVIVATGEPATGTAEVQVIQSQLKAINIDVEIDTMELGTYVDRWLKADFTAALALNGGRPDPYPMYSRYFQTGAQFADVAGYQDATLDNLMKEGQTETDPTKRHAIFDEFQKYLAQQSPWIWLFTQYNYTAEQNYVTGFTPTPDGYLYYLYQTKISR